MLLSPQLDVREYIDAAGKNPFRKWLDRLSHQAAAKIAAVLEKIAQGKISNIKGVGSGVLEYTLDWGPGYRVYLGRDGEKLVILLGGGTKKRQSADIDAAKACWAEYRQRKRDGEN